MINWFKKLISLIIVDFLKKTGYDFKISEIRDKISCITDLANTATRSNVKNKTPDISDILKKTDYDAKLITTSDYNKFRNSIFNAKIGNKKLVNEITTTTTTLTTTTTTTILVYYYTTMLLCYYTTILLLLQKKNMSLYSYLQIDCVFHSLQLS